MQITPFSMQTTVLKMDSRYLKMFDMVAYNVANAGSCLLKAFVGLRTCFRTEQMAPLFCPEPL
jgi:hypothetical protein